MSKRVKLSRVQRFIRRTLIEGGDAEHCYYCKTEFSHGIFQPTLDHKVAISRGGYDGAPNLVLACQRCNSWKGHKSYELFVHLLPKYLKQISDNPDTKFSCNRPVLPKHEYEDILKYT